MNSVDQEQSEGSKNTTMSELRKRSFALNILSLGI